MIFQVSNVLLLLVLFCLLKSVITLSIYESESLQDDIRSILVKLQVRRDDGSYRNLCSGSILSWSWVLTAAHCTKKYYNTIYVVDGTDESRRFISVADMKDAVRHPNYALDDPEHDIGLLLLNQLIDFYTDKKPAQFAAMRPEFGSAAIIAGYGAVEDNSIIPRQSNVTISSCSNCIRSNVICSQDLVRVGDGDSGGPIIYNGVLVGVITGSCQDYKTDNTIIVYASIAENIDWIKTVIKNEEN